jgi:transcriptional regulator with XRE-family HTH domain
MRLGARLRSVKHGQFLNLRAERIQQNIPVEEAAKTIGISRTWLYMIELGEREPSEEVKEKLANLYGKEEGYLFSACNQPINRPGIRQRTRKEQTNV